LPFVKSKTLFLFLPTKKLWYLRANKIISKQLGFLLSVHTIFIEARGRRPAPAYHGANMKKDSAIFCCRKQTCQVAVVTDTFQKCGRTKIVRAVTNWWPWKWLWVTWRCHDTNLAKSSKFFIKEIDTRIRKKVMISPLTLGLSVVLWYLSCWKFVDEWPW
jgi:hypothetical protein